MGRSRHGLVRPLPPEGQGDGDPRVWRTEDPGTTDAEAVLEEEPLGRFLLQYTLYEAMDGAPWRAWTDCMPAAHLEPLLDVLRPVPLSPFLPAHTADRFFAAPGLLASVSSDGDQAAVALGALHRESLTALLGHDFPWRRFDG